MPDVEAELRSAIEKILGSKGRKKLIVAGPGAGKTTLFKKLLEGTGGARDQRLVLTFINNLKDDLDRDLGDLARVYTLHGYCQYLLHQSSSLRNGLSSDFICYPGVIGLIEKDWQWLTGSPSPRYVELMRNLRCPEDAERFYFNRSAFYDAVDFDDSVYRTGAALSARDVAVPTYELILIDEFQDFNRMEAAVIDLLAAKNPIAIAGDDDQALYSQLRGASWEHIRAKYLSGEYELFELPFCMRCPEVVVSAVQDVIVQAHKLKKLNGRIEKPYRYFEPAKGADSRRFPKIEYVRTSVQRANANYFGRFIERSIQSIPKEEFDEAAKKQEACVLIIGSKPYLPQVAAHLVECGLVQSKAEEKEARRESALRILAQNHESNVGWRALLAEDDPDLAKEVVRESASKDGALWRFIPETFRERILDEARTLAEAVRERTNEAAEKELIKLTSYEGAKGLSAQYVFLIGLHDGELPKKGSDPQDIEICRFLVGLTRTRRHCTIIVTSRFGEDFKRPSAFLRWIDPGRYSFVEVNAAYWKR